MRKLALAVAIVSLGAAALIATAIAKNGGGGGGGTFHATLDGYQEVPMSISTTGNGRLVITRINRDAKTFEYHLTIRNLEGAFTPKTGAVGEAHIHLGQRHTNGGIAVLLCGGEDKPACPTNGTITGTVDAADIRAITSQGLEEDDFDELLSAMRAGATYANVHTTLYPGGEIRGQIDRGRHHSWGKRKDD